MVDEVGVKKCLVYFQRKDKHVFLTENSGFSVQMSEFDMEVSDGNKHRKARYYFTSAILLSLRLTILED